MVRMNKLTTEKRRQVVPTLTEECSTVRVTGVAKNAITKLLVDLGEVCSEYQDRVLRNLPCKRRQCGDV